MAAQLTVQAFGQSIGLTSLIWRNLQHLDPSRVLNFGAVLQTGRLFGAEIGAAFVETIIRVREQVLWNYIWLHVTTGSLITDSRLDYAQAVAGRSVGPPDAAARATELLGHSVQVQA
jgi:MFS transporter, DHA2 family, multidrug resistance protein